MTRETVWFFWRFTRPLSRLIFPAAAGGAAGGAGGAAGAGGAIRGSTGAAAGATGAAAAGTGVAAGAAGSSTETPKSVAMPASPFA